MSAPSGLSIRPATDADAALIARWGRALDAEVGAGRAPWNEAQVLRDGFNARPAFRVLIAERAAEPVGMALFFDAYDSDLCVRGLYLSDLYVDPAHRGEAVGEALMRALARAAAERGAASIFWAVHRGNEQVAAFYERLGARWAELRLMGIDGAALESLARLDS